MKQGTTVVKEVTIYGVEIEGRGGDSVGTEYFLSGPDAILASAIDGRNLSPQPVKVLKFSDGTYGVVNSFRISEPPSEEQVEVLRKKILARVKTPAEKFLFG